MSSDTGVFFQKKGGNTMRIVTVGQMKEAERRSDENGVSYYQLMKNAGTALGSFIHSLMIKENIKKVVFLAGSGNNGGDCFVAAEYLAARGAAVTAALVCGMPKTETAGLAFNDMNTDRVRVTEDRAEITEALSNADLIADGVFGTGFHGELRPGFPELLNAGRADALRIAVDIPSGGNAADGSVSDGCFRADYTVTFGFAKFGMTQQPLRSYCGEIHTADIGIPEGCCCDDDLILEETEKSFVRASIPVRRPASHKGTYGTLMCVTGSRNMPGAAVLSGRAALRTGLGLLKQCAPPENIAALAAAFPEPVYWGVETGEDGFYLPENADDLIRASEKSGAVLIGCGLGCTDKTKELVTKLLSGVKCTVVLDADGLNCIADTPDILNRISVPVIITPHPAEAARLLGISTAEIQRDRLGSIMKFTERFPEVVTVLKGAGTITGYKNHFYINTTGNPGMSTGGSGDVLAGITASLAAQGLPPHTAAATAVWIHGTSADTAADSLSQYSLLPSDIITHISTVLKSL